MKNSKDNPAMLAKSMRKSHKLQSRKWAAMRLLQKLGEIPAGTDLRRWKAN